MKNRTAREIEIRIAHYFGVRQNVIVPNASWGMKLHHEADILVMSKSRFVTEVEIKVSKSDIKRDLKKRNGHTTVWHGLYAEHIRRVFFAIPQHLEGKTEDIPEYAGILVVTEEHGSVKEVRPAKIRKNAQPFSPEQAFQLARLGTMRAWKAKEDLQEVRNTLEHYREYTNYVSKQYDNDTPPLLFDNWLEDQKRKRK